MKKKKTSKDEPWFCRIREGLFKDPSGKHYKRMGKALWLYLYLHACADWETGRLKRKYKTIQKESGIPESSAKKMMEKLRREGYIKTNRLGQALAIQITKFGGVKKKKKEAINGPPQEAPNIPRGTKSGLSQIIPRGTSFGTSEVPGMGTPPLKTHFPSVSKDREKSTRWTKSGLSNETPLIKTQKNKHSIAHKKAFDSKPEKPKKAPPKTNPNIKIAIDHYHDEFFRIHGVKPRIDGGKHGAVYKSLLEGDGKNGNAPLSISEVKEAITRYVSQTKKRKVDFAFEEDWQTYPNKAGKEQARKKYNSSVGKELLENRPKFQKAMKNYLSFVDHERNNGFPNRRHKDGSTFFNEWKGWVDYKPPEEAPVEDTEKELEVSL